MSKSHFEWMGFHVCILIAALAFLAWGGQYVVSLIAWDEWAVGRATCSSPVLGVDSAYRLTIWLTCGTTQAHTDDPKTAKDLMKGRKTFDCVIYRSCLARCK